MDVIKHVTIKCFGSHAQLKKLYYHVPGRIFSNFIVGVPPYDYTSRLRVFGSQFQKFAYSKVFCMDW